jgi:hypothetical protein
MPIEMARDLEIVVYGVVIGILPRKEGLRQVCSIQGNTLVWDICSSMPREFFSSGQRNGLNPRDGKGVARESL